MTRKFMNIIENRKILMKSILVLIINYYMIILRKRLTYINLLICIVLMSCTNDTNKAHYDNLIDSLLNEKDIPWLYIHQSQHNGCDFTYYSTSLIANSEGKYLVNEVSKKYGKYILKYKEKESKPLIDSDSIERLIGFDWKKELELFYVKNQLNNKTAICETLGGYTAFDYPVIQNLILSPSEQKTQIRIKIDRISCIEKNENSYDILMDGYLYCFDDTDWQQIKKANLVTDKTWHSKWIDYYVKNDSSNVTSYYTLGFEDIRLEGSNLNLDTLINNLTFEVPDSFSVSIVYFDDCELIIQ